MWDKIASAQDTDLALKLVDSTYLGCRQSEFPLDDDVKIIIESRQPLVDWCFKSGHESSQGGAKQQQNIDTPEAELPMRGVDRTSFSNTNAASSSSGGEERSSRKDQEKLASRYIEEFKKDPKCWEYNMSGHARSAVEKYLNLAKLSETSLKKVSTPCIDDHQISDEDFEVKGHLDHIASQIVLTCLYLAGTTNPIFYGA